MVNIPWTTVETSTNNYYNSIADGYNELHGQEQRRKAKLVLSKLEQSDIDGFLDVGGGTGYATEIFPGKRVLLEPSEKLRAKAKGAAIEGVAERLPFPDKSFSLVVCLTAIHHFKDPKKALSEMKRVCQRQVVVSLLKKAQNYRKLDSVIRKILKNCEILDDLHDMIYIWNR